MSGGFILFFGFLALGYLFMGGRALLLAWDKVQNDTSSAWQALFSTKERAGQTVETVIIVLIIPLFISWGSSVFDTLDELKVVGAAFYACLSMLFVLITLELSTLNSLNRDSQRPWRALLIWACVWDVMSIILLLSFIKPKAEEAQQAAEALLPVFDSLAIYIYSIAAFAFLASFSVVLFSIGSQREVDNESD